MNIILIGMPGAGKSTLGVLLAKTLGMSFVDTDIVLQEKEGRLLHEILNTDGLEYFLEAEESTVMQLEVENCVIATGGSVVYSQKAMEYLRSTGIAIYLYVSFEEIQKRIRNIKTRGIVIPRGKNLEDIYKEREPLYMTHCDIMLDCTNKSVEQTVTEAVLLINELDR